MQRAKVTVADLARVFNAMPNDTAIESMGLYWINDQVCEARFYLPQPGPHDPGEMYVVSVFEDDEVKENAIAETP